VDRFFFRSGGATSSPAKLVADELRVGYTWSDVTSPGRPQLAIQLSDTSLNLRWSAKFSGYFLEASSSLSPPAWLPTTNAVSVIGSWNTVSLPLGSQSARYFRLRR
jgi:hypothetical protein